MTGHEAVEYLHSLPRLGGGATLARMQALMARLGNPEAALKCVHIAGTNGKGTVATLTASILRKAGFKVGLTVSPYVLEFRERFQINGGMIGWDELTAITAEVKAAAEAMEAAGEGIPVEFEAVTAVALCWFARSGCDLVVLETGLGGRYDATNVVPNTLVAAITCIGLDHTALLGNTVDKIAREKAGILKPGCIAVSYPAQPGPALRVLMTEAKALKCPLVVPDPDDLHRSKGRPFENRFEYGGYEVVLPFPGRHQSMNAAMAIEIALALWRKGYDITDEQIIEGLESARFPARIEVLRKEPLLLLDGSHNPDGAEALADTLKEARCRGLVAVMGMLKDKDVQEVLHTLAPCFERVYTVTPDCPRAMDAWELSELASKEDLRTTTCESLSDALDKAVASGKGVVVCGSLYLAAQARPLMLELAAPEEPDAPEDLDDFDDFSGCEPVCSDPDEEDEVETFDLPAGGQWQTLDL